MDEDGPFNMLSNLRVAKGYARGCITREGLELLEKDVRDIINHILVMVNVGTLLTDENSKKIFHNYQMSTEGLMTKALDVFRNNPNDKKILKVSQRRPARLDVYQAEEESEFEEDVDADYEDDVDACYMRYNRGMHRRGTRGGRYGVGRRPMYRNNYSKPAIQPYIGDRVGSMECQYTENRAAIQRNSETSKRFQPNQAIRNISKGDTHKKSPIVCYRCGKVGHISSMCKASQAEVEAHGKNVNKKHMDKAKKTSYVADVEPNEDDD
jgi:hypothetical protein